MGVFLVRGLMELRFFGRDISEKELVEKIKGDSGYYCRFVGVVGVDFVEVKSREEVLEILDRIDDIERGVLWLSRVNEDGVEEYLIVEF